MQPSKFAGLFGLAALGAQAQVPPAAEPTMLDPIVVTATRSLKPEMQTVRDTIVITRTDLDAAGNLSLAEVLQRNAGIEFRATGGPGQPGGLFIRGATSGQTLVLIDGIRVNNPLGTTSIENIPLEMIERIEVVKGPVSSLYGADAIGGVVQVFTRGKKVPHFFANAGYGEDNDWRVSTGVTGVDKKTADGIRDEIAGREFAPDAAKFGYSSHLDLQTGRVVVQTDAPAEVTERLLKEHPDEIELRDGKPLEDLFHRRDDIPSFWGGASIQSGGATCSTGFTVRKPSGARLITTAAHCYGVGATVRTPTSTFVGNVTQRGTLGSIFFWDNRDVELIGGSSYAPRVYTGGVFSTSSRGIVGAGNPVAGFTGYCSSGQTSGEQCQQTVQSTQAIVCTQTGCKWPIIEYTGGPARPGDSGGSFYLPSGSTQAHARGAVIAGDGTTSYAEKWSRMSSSMGVSIAT